MNAPATRLRTNVIAAMALAPSSERRRLRIYTLQMIADAVSILGSFVLAGGIYQSRWPAPMALLEAQVLLPVYLTIALYQGVYSIKSITELRFAVGRSALAMAVAAGLLMFITFYTRSAEFSRVMFTIALVLCFASLAGTRIAVDRALRRAKGGPLVNLLVIDDGGPPVVIDGALTVDAASEGLVPDVTDPHRLDQLGRYFANMDRVIVSCPLDRRPDWAFVLRAAGARGEVTSDSLHELRPLGLRDNGSSVSLLVSTGPLGLRARATKRVFDCLVAGAALLIVSPVLILTALAIKLEDRGPVLFVQRRLGRGNRFFRMLKFRSMAVRSCDSEGNRSTSRNDDRCTRVGRFIRRTSIDELPQLFNVLKGEMSVVGPRPHALGSQAGDKLFWEVDGHYWHRHSLKPGLTGLAQVRGWRGATERAEDLEGRLQADLEYISSWSLWRDLWIMLKTVGVLAHQKAF